MLFDIEHNGESHRIEVPDQSALQMSKRRLEENLRIDVTAMQDFKGSIFKLSCGELKVMAYYPKRLANSTLVFLRNELENQLNAINGSLRR